MTTLIQRYIKDIQRICGESDISYLAVFGSQARNEARSDSDVDLLVEFKKTPGLIKFIQIKQKFEEILNRKVDLVTKKGLSKYLAPYIYKDTQQLYG